jgi:hypothetical protein
VLELCQELQVVTRPTRLGDVWVLPVLSWHHKVCWVGSPLAAISSSVCDMSSSDVTVCPGHSVPLSARN